MKKIFSAFLLAAVSLTAGTFEYQFKPHQARKIEIGSAPAVTMVQNGKIGFEIVTPADASPTAKFAAKEAAELLGKAFGTRISVKTVPSGNIPALIIGDKKLAVQAKLNLRQLDRDGFYIKSVGNNVLIIGRDDAVRRPASMPGNGDSGERATLFGLYDFLERFAGIRFFFPGDCGTVIPKMREWKLPVIDIADRPDQPQRLDYFNCTSARHRNVCFPQELGKKVSFERRFRQRQQSWTWPCCHGLDKMGYHLRFPKTHPEYFAHDANGRSVLNMGRDCYPSFCYSSPMREEIIQDAISWLNGRPASERGIRPFRRQPNVVAWHNQLDLKTRVFDITAPDSYYPCQCPKCRKLFAPGDGKKTDKRLSDFMWRFYAEAANRIKDKGYIAAWSYWPTIYEPEFDLPENMLLVLCVRGPWNFRNRDAWEKELARVKAWGKRSGAKVRLWNYWIKTPWGSLLDIPDIAPRAVSAYYKAVAPHTCGAFVENETERYLYQYLNQYIFYRTLWNNSADVEKLLADHHRAMFGPAAAEMKAVYDELENRWLSISGNAVDTPEGPVAVVPSEYDTWTRFYPEKVMNAINGHFDAAEKLCRKDAEALKRVRFIRRELWQPTVNARQAWLKSLSVRDNWKHFATAGTPQKIDGDLNDAAWKKATPMYLTGFQRETVEVPTTVKMLFDKDNFYFGFDCTEPDTAKMVAAPYAPDDSDRWANQTVELFLNPGGDRKSFYQLMIDTRGTLTDYHWKNGVFNTKWNSNAEIKVKIIPGKRWMAEVKLPRAAMEKAVDQMPANFLRHRARTGAKSENYVWCPFLKAKMAEPDSWGVISLVPETNPSIVKFGDFETPVRSRRWVGPWYGDKVLERDEKVYLTGGGSIKLTQQVNRGVTQYLKLKPETLYEVSFFAKLDHVGDKTSGGLRVRFDEMGGNVTWLPNIGTPLRGTIPWTRFAYRVKTDAKCGSKSRKGGYAPYICITLSAKTDGTAWIDHVEVREVK